MRSTCSRKVEPNFNDCAIDAALFLTLQLLCPKYPASWCATGAPASSSCCTTSTTALDTPAVESPRRSRTNLLTVSISSGSSPCSPLPMMVPTVLIASTRTYPTWSISKRAASSASNFRMASAFNAVRRMPGFLESNNFTITSVRTIALRNRGPRRTSRAPRRTDSFSSPRRSSVSPTALKVASLSGTFMAASACNAAMRTYCVSSRSNPTTSGA
mmetsp:Transcript_11266/g.26955  ORF Transcript_11266/g.26955 Transcript_11266/m.26955 type:complete len:215 (+) Transcript_11266:447-1091(+)